MNTRKPTPSRIAAAGNIVVQESVLGPAAWGSNVLSPHIGGLPAAQSLNHAGQRKYRDGDFTGALEELQATAAVAQAARGRNHGVTAHYLNKVGVMLKVLGRDEEALAIHQEVLRIQETIPHPDAPEIAHGCNNVATALEGLGRAAETGPYYNRAIRIEGQVFGRSGDPTLATRLNQMGTLYLAGQLHAAARLVAGIIDDVARRHSAGDMSNRPLATMCLRMLAKLNRAVGRQTFKGRHEALLRDYGLLR